jgi:hypothetical protein
MEEIMIKFRQARIVYTYFFDYAPHVNRRCRAVVDECRELLGQLLTVFAAQGSSRTSHHKTERNESFFLVRMILHLGYLLQRRGGVTECDNNTTTTRIVAAVSTTSAEKSTTELHRLQGRLVQGVPELLQTRR